MTSSKQLEKTAAEIINPVNLPRHKHFVSRLILEINKIITDKNLESVVSNLSETNLACGLATSPKDAATCIDETLRTMKLMMAVYHACNDAIEKRNGDFPLRILYAGCGPLAPAILAAATLLPPDKVKFVLMDIHEDSIKAAKIITDGLGIGESIEEYIVADAASYRHNREYYLNGLIVFSFNNGLSREPQLAVTANMASQVTAPAMMIPEAIDFFSYIVDPEEELQSQSENGEKLDFIFNPEKASETRIELGPVFRLNRNNASEIHKLVQNNRSGKTLNINMATFKVPQNRPDGKNTLMLTSVIIFYDSIVLGEYESPLTYPWFFLHGQSLSEGSGVTFSYVLSSSPGFIHTVGKQ